MLPRWLGHRVRMSDHVMSEAKGIATGKASFNRSRSRTIIAWHCASSAISIVGMHCSRWAIAATMYTVPLDAI